MDVLPFTEPQVLDPSRPRRAHLVGIAGNGMRALADVLAGWGWMLSGSDLDIDGYSRRNGPKRTDAVVGKALCEIAGSSPITSSVPVPGVRLFAGHAAEHLSPQTELVVYSDAVPAANPELRRAAELGIPTLSYFQMLGRLGIGRRTVAVAGTHGKSTVTAMLAHLLILAGLDPTVVCGATPIGATSGGRAGGEGAGAGGQGAEIRGQGPGCLPPSAFLQSPSLQISQSPNPLLIVEACEYRANFLHLRPRQAAITGIELDHFDCYDSIEQLEAAFRRFAESIPGDGLLIARHDCESTQRVVAGLICRTESFGFSPQADWSANVHSAGVPPALQKPHEILALDNAGETSALRLEKTCFEIRRFGRRLCEIELPMPGRHNVLNAVAAAALAYAGGVSAEQISQGLRSFPGLHRRLEVLRPWRGVTLIDDYAHHPTEVTAALAAIRCMAPAARVWCVFQPHQASRTARLLDRFAVALQNADKLLVADIFRAREGDPRPGEITAADLARRAAHLGVEVLPTHSAREIVETLKTQLAPGDVLVTLGAGDTWKLRPGQPEGRNDE
jgi:UDP-N-acetylmuramate--alanine ligase